MFNALLVELGYFEKITVSFLIVGHTHASIDQYFSCLRKLIRRASFIASPLALHHLFSLDKSSSETAKSRLRSPYRPPIRQVQITFIRDYTAALAPYRSKFIKNYGIPYQFQFFMHLGKCICQYKQFSTSLEWLPPIADYVSSTVPPPPRRLYKRPRKISSSYFYPNEFSILRIIFLYQASRVNVVSNII